MSTVRFPGVPFPLVSEGRPSGHEPRALSSGVELTAAPRADLFLDPGGFDVAPDAERFLAPVAGDFQLSARVSVDFRSTFDSGVLIGYVDDLTWFKLCAELEPGELVDVADQDTRVEGAAEVHADPCAQLEVAGDRREEPFCVGCDVEPSGVEEQIGSRSRRELDAARKSSGLMTRWPPLAHQRERDTRKPDGRHPHLSSPWAQWGVSPRLFSRRPGSRPAWC